ncbi:MAG TPA: hypothetical protein VHV57_08255 [Acidimicrobiales bacterium]|nr:hypothetical protein [Acidimicrobiales bacterium]
MATALCVGTVIGIVLWQMHLPLLLNSSTTTGGDNGGHYALPAFLDSTLLSHWQLTGWDPQWYDGFPLYTYYFVLPDLLIALASHVIGYAVAFKWGTVLGSVLLPVAAWAMGRLFGMRRAFPGALAAISLCFLFDYTYTIYGGNLFSTLAGEYAYSLSIALALLFLGLMARGLRTGRHRGWSAVVLALCILAHIVPALFAIVGAALLLGLEMLPDKMRPHDSWLAQPNDRVVLSRLTRVQALWWGVSTVGLGVMLVAFWWIPFGIDQPYANAMGYTNVHTFVAILLPQADWWVLILAGLSALAALAMRSRFGILMGLLAGLSALAVIFDPQGSLYNTRFLPLWFLSVYLLAGWGIAAAVTGVVDLAEWWQRRNVHSYALASAEVDGATGASEWMPPRKVGASWSIAGVAGPLVTLVVALAVVVTPFVLPFSTLQSIGITPGANQVTNWSAFNYKGYENQAAYPEYHAVLQTMEKVGRTNGCGQAMWQYDPSLNRFGTTMALMLLPYWSHGCIGSMEGLLFESSATTPYHFLNQAELSEQPSEPMVGLDYSALNVPQGIEHLQLLGVRYFMASSPTVEAAADADPSLTLLASTGPWTSTTAGSTTTTTWKIYQVAQSREVTPLANDPAVEVGIKAGQSSWLPPSEAWYNDPARWNVELAQSGPASWPRVPIGDPAPPQKATAPTRVSHIHESDNGITFHVTRVGTPVLVKVSYFPNWKASGATGPYRVTPNLMVVVPTAHNVSLQYGATAANRVGQLLSLLGVLGLLAGLVVPRLRRRRTGSENEMVPTP